MRLDAVIFGGGAAGLWLLDELSRRGHSALLLEAAALGQGQTIASQGIIHGGLKYSLKGMLTPSALSVRDMPGLWRASLAGTREPDLSRTPRRADFCYLWSTGSFGARWGMLGARIGLRATHRRLADDERPAALAGCPGRGARLEEPVLSPPGFLANLAAPHWHRILLINRDSTDGWPGLERSLAVGPAPRAGQRPAAKRSSPGHPAAVEWNIERSGNVHSIVMTSPGTSRQLELKPGHVIFTAGAGNAELRRQVGLDAGVMQRRPLHMVMARGRLPALNGHCIDGAKTRLTVTSDEDTSGRTVWQIGGQVAEQGVGMQPDELIAHAQSEVHAVLPGIDLSGSEWATYRIDRAEGATPSGGRPHRIQILREGNTITAWPTKLALAPVLAECIANRIGIRRRSPHPLIPLSPHRPHGSLKRPSDEEMRRGGDEESLHDWPRPEIALPPWENCRDWESFDRKIALSERAA